MDSTTRMDLWIKLNIDFNKNHKTRALREAHGDWMPLVWIELLIDSQSRHGFIPGSLADLAAEYSKLWMSPRVDKTLRRRQRGGKRATDRCLKGLQHMMELGMIRVENDGIKICNSSRYKKKDAKREKKRIENTRVDREAGSAMSLEIASYKELLRTIIELYPSAKVDKVDLLQKLWNAKSLWQDASLIIASIVEWKASAEWKKNKGQYIPQLINFVDHKKYLQSPHPSALSANEEGGSLVTAHQQIMEERHAE